MPAATPRSQPAFCTDTPYSLPHSPSPAHSVVIYIHIYHSSIHQDFWFAIWVPCLSYSILLLPFERCSERAFLSILPASPPGARFGHGPANTNGIGGHVRHIPLARRAAAARRTNEQTDDAWNQLRPGESMFDAMVRCSLAPRQSWLSLTPARTRNGPCPLTLGREPHRAPEMALTHALFVPGTQLDHQFECECLSSSMLSWLAAAVPRTACLLGASCGLTPLADPRNHVVMGWI